MWDRFEALENRYESLTRELMDPQVQAQSQLFQEKAKQHAEMSEMVARYRKYKEVVAHRAQAEGMLASEKEAELQEMAREELVSLESQKAELEKELRLLLLPKDPLDSHNVILEIRAGTGGDEASLFAGELLRMYTRFAETRGWKVELMDSNPSEVGGFKEIIALVRGGSVYRILKHEAGVHRVQRVPKTEASGRIHTSTVTVVVMPEMEEKEIKIEEKDLKIETFCASGHGGQSVNTTYSAVRMTHLPSGIVVSMQDERSQLKNRGKAMKVLMARLTAREEDRRVAAASSDRKSQVGGGERSEKIRTYNFPQNRVTDHRVGFSIHNLAAVMEGSLDALLEKLLEQEQAEKLATLAAV